MIVALVLFAALVGLAAIYAPYAPKPERGAPNAPENPADGVYSRTIPTSYGNLTLRYENGATTLSGTLSRGTPCIDWRARASASGSNPPTAIQFDVDPVSTADVCIQVEGAPQAVTASTPAAANARYVIRVRNEIVFSGTLQEGAEVTYGELQGKVTVGPLCPVERPDKPCKPTAETFSRVRIAVEDSRGVVVQEVKILPDGDFYLRLPSGSYTVRVASEYGIGGTRRSYPVMVSAGKTTSLVIAIDTGIR